MHRLPLKGASLLIAAVLTQAAVADTTLIFTSADNEGTETSKTEIADGMVRMSTPGTDGDMVFDSNNNRIIALNHQDRSYMIMDQATIEKLINMQKQMMAQMEAQLQALPASQREQMKKMMGQMMPGGMGNEPQPRSYERTGESREIAGYDCEVLEVYSGDRKASEQCVVDASDLDIPDADYATVRGMMDFVQQLAEGFSQMSDEIVDFGEPGEDEIPVQFTHYSKMAGTNTGQLQSISQDDIDPAVFAIPNNYKEQKIPELDQF
ncbi:MAG: DUF4412 domain-containing protein [Pseudomonadota bacterium]